MTLHRIMFVECDTPGCSERLDIPFERSSQPWIFIESKGWRTVVPEGRSADMETYCPRGVQR